MMAKKVFFTKLVLVAFLCQLSLNSQAQLFGKGTSGFLVLDEGAKMEGFLKSGTFDEDGQLMSLKYSDTEDGKFKKYKTKNIREYSFRGKHFIKARIKVGLIGRKKEMFCKMFYKSDMFIVLNDPMEAVFIRADELSVKNEEDNMENTAFHISKNRGEFIKITRLNYKKSISEICGDNPEWMSKANDESWLKFWKIVENLKYYEESVK